MSGLLTRLERAVHGGPGHLTDDEIVEAVEKLVAERDALAARDAAEAWGFGDAVRKASQIGRDGPPLYGADLVERVRSLAENAQISADLDRTATPLRAFRRAVAAELSPDGALDDRELLDLLRQRLRASAPEYAGSPAADGRAVQALLDAHDYPLRDLGPVVRVMRLLAMQGVDLAGDAGGEQ